MICTWLGGMFSGKNSVPVSAATNSATAPTSVNRANPIITARRRNAQRSTVS